MNLPRQDTAEHARLSSAEQRSAHWKRWGTYLAEREWGTAREDYSADGAFWQSFSHDAARSRAYRWGEDGILGFCDRQCRLCFSVVLWNGRDPVLKERLFGLTGPEGNHGEDVKELYYYLDATPTYSYCKGLYKYPHAEFPYAKLIDENQRRGKTEPEFEIQDTGVFAENRYFDVQVEYAKASPDDLLIRITATNRGPQTETLHLLPQLWFRNTWAWGNDYEDATAEPHLERIANHAVAVQHETLGEYILLVETQRDVPTLLFTDNETHHELLYGVTDARRWSKDAFHSAVVKGQAHAVNPGEVGTKMAAWYKLALEPNTPREVRLRLRRCAQDQPSNIEALREDFSAVFAARQREADEFYQAIAPTSTSAHERLIARQAYAGLLWTKQFYHYAVELWLNGDKSTPTPPAARKRGRNSDWQHLFNRDIVSMPDKWEYPWYAAWDLAFHMVPFGRIDPDFAKEQLTLFLREWYMHPNGQLPAYELNLGDVNPPVHAWACWRVYQLGVARGQPDRRFLQSCFHKLLLNFTWWVNRKDPTGRHLFSGGFLGLDNIGVFDRNQALPNGHQLQQADGTAWMAFFCLSMLSIAIELAQTERVYADMASKFLEHFVQIAGAMNKLGTSGLWDNEEGFFYDQLWNESEEKGEPIRVRSLVGLLPLIAVEVYETKRISHLRGFVKRALWFIDNRRDLAEHLVHMNRGLRNSSVQENYALAIVSRRQLRRVLAYMLDENEFLSPYGIRSLSKSYDQHPYEFEVGGKKYEVSYAPGESTTTMFGGNSNWRGPIWFPINYLLIEALRKWHAFYGETLRVECPTDSGVFMDLGQVADELQRRLCRLFLPDEAGKRPCFGPDLHNSNPTFANSLLFHEYFHGDSGQGLGASHQTGWTALVASCIEELHEIEERRQRAKNPQASSPAVTTDDLAAANKERPLSEPIENDEDDDVPGL